MRDGSNVSRTFDVYRTSSHDAGQVQFYENAAVRILSVLRLNSALASFPDSFVAYVDTSVCVSTEGPVLTVLSSDSTPDHSSSKPFLSAPFER
jgi:hypothetical protein